MKPIFLPFSGSIIPLLTEHFSGSFNRIWRTFDSSCQPLTPAHSAHSALPHKPAHQSILCKTYLIFWNFWAASLSQKKKWLDEKCVSCSQWYFMCKRSICYDSHQLPHLETWQSLEQPHVHAQNMSVNTENCSSAWGIEQQKPQLTSVHVSWVCGCFCQ